MLTGTHLERLPVLRILGAVLLVALGFAILFLPAASARQVKKEELPAPREEPPKARAVEGPEILQPSADAGLAAGIPITLLDALKIASLGNLDIAQARLLVERGRANYNLFRSRFLPNIGVGTTYTTHDGTIQNTAGNISEVDRDSLFVGMQTFYAVSLSDALFLPAEARRLLDAVRIGQVRITNDTLLRVADAYFDVLLARRRLASSSEALDFLVSTQESDLRGGSHGLLPLIRAFVRRDTALPSDQARVEADVIRLYDERTRAAQDLRTTSAELARLLRIDPTIFLMPADDFRNPLPIHGTAWGDAPMDILVGQALRSRPELAENNALLEAALARYRSTKWQPLLPTVAVNYAYGGFGGGPPIVGKTASGTSVLGNSGSIANFDTRSDFEINLFWRLQGLGLGNLALQRDARLRVDQSRVRQVQVQDTVVSQVVRALESVQRSRERVAIVRSALFDEAGRPNGVAYRSIRLNFLRIKSNQGTPLEVLDSIRRLADILNSYNAALTDYDRARYRLIVRLGLPTPALIDPACMPSPPVLPRAEPAPVAPLPKVEGAPGPIAPLSSAPSALLLQTLLKPLATGGIAGGVPFDAPYTFVSNPPSSAIVSPESPTPAIVPARRVEPILEEKPWRMAPPDDGLLPNGMPTPRLP
jgi:outer membrane protein TolC